MVICPFAPIWACPWAKNLSNLVQIGSRLCMRSHATPLLMPVIICTKYGKNPPRTVDATEWTRFSRPRPNDFEDIGQGQRSLYATHPLILVIICAKYGKSPSRTVDFFQGQAEKFVKNSNFQILKKRNTPWCPLTLTYIFKVIRPWLWKSCPLCNVFSSISIISIFATNYHYH